MGLPKYTEVLTTDGWISIDKLTLEHEIASLLKEQVVFKKPNAVQCYEYSGNFIQFRDSNGLIELMTTPKHLIWVAISDEYKLAFAENMIKRYEKHQWQKNVLANCAISDNTFESIVRKFSKLIRKVMYHNRTNKSFEAYRLPDFVWKLDADRSRQLLDVLMDYSPKMTCKCWIISQLDLDLAGDIQRLCLQAGLSGNIERYDLLPTYELHVFDTLSDSRPVLELDSCLEFGYDTELQNNENVYSVQVEGGVYYVRQNGKTCWTGA